MYYPKYYNSGMTEKYLVQNWSQTKSSGTKLLEVHGIKEILDINLLPEKQKIAPQVEKSIETKPRVEQGRMGIKWKKTCITKNINTLTDKLQELPKIPATQNIAKKKDGLSNAWTINKQF